MKRLKNILTLIAVVLCSVSYGQSWTGQAYNFYKARDFESAQVAIDSAIQTIEQNDPQTWQLRGIIYREVTSGDSLKNRQIAIESFVYAREIDSAGIYTGKINNYLKNTVIRYYNNAVTLLKYEKEFEQAVELYNLYKKQYKRLLDPDYNFNERDIQFYIALGIEYQNKAAIVPQKLKNDWRYKAIDAFNVALEIDSMSFQANFNSGAAYYSIAVDYIQGSEDDISIDDLILKTKMSEEAFLKALPYLKRAEKVKPDHMDTKVALMGCYYGLNNDEMYMKYQAEVDQVNLPKYLERYESHPEDTENIKELIRIYRHTIPNEEEAVRFENILYDLLQNGEN